MLPGNNDDKIRTFKDAKPGISQEDFFREIAKQRFLKLPKGETSTQSVRARIDHGRWLADCPFCAGAELIDLDDLRFWCGSCGNADIQGKWLRVIMPGDHHLLERLVLSRSPERRNWNWDR